MFNVECTKCGNRDLRKLKLYIKSASKKTINCECLECGNKFEFIWTPTENIKN